MAFAIEILHFQMACAVRAVYFRMAVAPTPLYFADGFANQTSSLHRACAVLLMGSCHSDFLSFLRHYGRDYVHGNRALETSRKHAIETSALETSVWHHYYHNYHYYS